MYKGEKREWRMIIATRNKLIHGYLGIDNDTVWSAIQDDIPTLLHDLLAIRNRVGNPIST